jgi:hypothetical protein
VIPCNTVGSKRNLPKSKSVENLDKIEEKEADPGSPQKIPMDGPSLKELSKDLADKQLMLVANRARDVERKNKKMKSMLT